MFFHLFNQQMRVSVWLLNKKNLQNFCLTNQNICIKIFVPGTLCHISAVVPFGVFLNIVSKFCNAVCLCVIKFTSPYPCGCRKHSHHITMGVGKLLMLYSNLALYFGACVLGLSVIYLRGTMDLDINNFYRRFCGCQPKAGLW